MYWTWHACIGISALLVSIMAQLLPQANSPAPTAMEMTSADASSAWKPPPNRAGCLSPCHIIDCDVKLYLYIYIYINYILRIWKHGYVKHVCACTIYKVFCFSFFSVTSADKHMHLCLRYADMQCVSLATWPWNHQHCAFRTIMSITQWWRKSHVQRHKHIYMTGNWY